MSKNAPNLDESCDICGQTNSSTLETHHVVPKRYGGSDHPENLVSLCGSCHNAVERIYDESFYQRFGQTPLPLGEKQERGQLGIELHSVESPDRKFPHDALHVSRSDLSAYRLLNEYDADDEEATDLEARIDSVSLPELKTSFENHYMENRLKKRLKSRANEKRLEEKDGGPLTPGPTYEEILEEEEIEQVVEVLEKEVDDILEEIDESSEWGYTHHAGNVDFHTHSGVTHIKDGESAYISNLLEVLHCGYCNRSFLPWQQADCAKHLQLSHGVENPYEEEETPSLIDSEMGYHAE